MGEDVSEERKDFINKRKKFGFGGPFGRDGSSTRETLIETTVAKLPKRMNNLTGKGNSLEELIVEHQPRLKAFIRKRVSSKEDAEDILQDVLYQLVKTIESTFNPIEQVTAWLYRVARNTIINKGKKMQEEKLPDSSYDKRRQCTERVFGSAVQRCSAYSEVEYMRSLVWQELETALAELPPEQREAFELLEMEGLSAKEVASATGYQSTLYYHENIMPSSTFANG